ncbi:MAG TPA: hypothetical protein H9915_03905 [Candidatus Gemmiger faecigallinarum]|nr:hypothetical protein [Candidatus Gemmiger faecigallinarum]
MPSKRTNDSVERILQELNREQEAKGIRDGVTDSNVDEILRSIPRSTAPADDVTATLGPIPDADMPKVEVSADLADPESRFSTQAINELLADLPIFQQQNGASRPSGQPAAQPARRTQPQAAPQPQPQPRSAAQPEAAPRPAEEPARPQQPQRPQPEREAAQPDAGQTAQARRGATADTTRTGIIKNFLRQMGSDDDMDAAQLSQRKNQFQRFFEESVAVVPDQNGRMPPEKKKKKRGIFGFGGGDTGEITDEFVPINVSLTSHRAGEAQPEPQAQQTPEPAQEAEPEPQAEAAPRPRKGGLFGLFGRRDEPEEETYGELDLAGDAEDAVPRQEEPLRAAPAAPDRPEPFPEPEPEPEPQKYVYHSKYAGTRRVHGSLADTLSSLGLYRTSTRDLRTAAREQAAEPPAPPPQAEPAPREPAQQEPAAQQPAAQQPAAVQPPRRKKKRDTVEFTPGQKAHALPDTPPQAEAFPSSEPVGEPVMTGSNTLTTGFTISMDRPAEREDTHDFVAAVQQAAALHPNRRSARQPEPEDVTGQVRLEPAPTAAPPSATGEVSLGAGPQQPEPTGDFALDFLDNQVEQRPDTAQFVRGIAQTLNTIPDEDEPDTGRYAEAARRLTREEPDDGEEPPKKRSRRPRMTGMPEDEREHEPEGPFPAGRAHHKLDYETTEDAPRVRQELDNQVLYRTVTTIVSAVATLLLLYLGTAAAGDVLPLPAMLTPGIATGESAAAMAAAGATAAPLLVVMLILLLVVCGLNWQTMAFGLLGLARAPTADTMPAMAAVGAVLQLVVFLIQPAWYRSGELCLLAGPAALVLCLNAAGKQMDARTVRANFDLVSAGVDHAVAYRLRDATVVRTVTRGLGEPKPSLLVSRPTVLLKNFLAGSSARRTSDKNQQQFSWILGVCGLLSFVFTLFYRQDAGMAFTALAAVWCLGAPLAGTLISALPAQRMQQSAARVGAVIPGWKDIRQLGRINVIQITARDLFPTGCVALAGIRPVGKERIDQAITYAASILAEGSPTLRDVFLGMIGDNRKLLSKVDDLKTVYGKGYVGWIDGNRVLVGNRAMMQDYGIKIPSLEFEQRHSVNQRRVVYLASSGNLMAMFLVSYQRDPDTAAVLESLRQAGMSMIVDCDDFNCDVHLIEAVYGLPSGSVKVLTPEEREVLAPATAWLPESEGNMLHLGSFASFVGGLQAAAGAAEGEYRAGIVLTASVLISCVIAVIMSLAGGIASLPLPAMVLYQVAWAVLALVFPMTRRY